MIQLVEQKFGEWRPAPGQPQDVPPIPTNPLAPPSDYAGALLIYSVSATQPSTAAKGEQ